MKNYYKKHFLKMEFLKYVIDVMIPRDSSELLATERTLFENFKLRFSETLNKFLVRNKFYSLLSSFFNSY